MFFFVEFHPEDDRKRSKPVGRLPHSCVYYFVTNCYAVVGLNTLKTHNLGT